MAKYSIQIECDEWWVADSLHEIGSEIENTDILDQMVDGKVEVIGDHYKATIIPSQSKEELMELIDIQLEGCNTQVEDLWINNSDGEGEDIEVESIGYKDGVCGLYMADGDFYCLSELSYNELDEIYDYLLNN